MLQGPEDLLIEQPLNFEFKASNNQVKYEALVSSMTLSLEMGASTLQAKSDSQLVLRQIFNDYHTNGP